MLNILCISVRVSASAPSEFLWREQAVMRFPLPEGVLSVGGSPGAVVNKYADILIWFYDVSFLNCCVFLFVRI